MGVIKTSPEQGKLNVAKKATQEFIGKAWKNVTKQGKHEGTEYLNVTLDEKISAVSMKAGDRLLLWPNSKRTEVNPKTNKAYQDADYRVSLVTA